MTGKDIFLGLRYIGADLIEEAETAPFPGKARKVLPFRRTLLIAAAVALAAVLVGCGVVYMLKMQDIRLGEKTSVYESYEMNDQGIPDLNRPVEETVTYQVLTLAGHKSTPAVQAAQAWHDFLESYDPNLDVLLQVNRAGPIPEFPPEYASVNLYTQEMKDTLDGILETYSLQLPGKVMDFGTRQHTFQCTGLERILVPGSPGELDPVGATFYENGVMDVAFRLNMPGQNTVSGVAHYRNKDCFTPDTALLAEAAWEEWNHTTPAGSPLLLLRSEEASTAWIFCDNGLGTVSVRLNAVVGMDGARPVMMEKEQIQEIADQLDFSQMPKLVDGWQEIPDPLDTAGAECNGYRLDVVQANTDGLSMKVILQITAPEGVTLDVSRSIHSGSGPQGIPREDGDGKANTCYYEITSEDLQSDGNLNVRDDTLHLVWEGLYDSVWDGSGSYQYNRITEGLWKLDIPLEMETDFIEFLTQPTRLSSVAGFTMTGEDVLKEATVTSVRLTPMGIIFAYEKTEDNPSADFFACGQNSSMVVMLDGTTYDNLWQLKEVGPIDLSQVAYLRMFDGTILPAPGVEEGTIQSLEEDVQAAINARWDPVPEYPDGVELLTDPIIFSHEAGYATDPSGNVDILCEYLKIDSMILHSGGLLHTPGYLQGQTVKVVMKDGREIPLTDGEYYVIEGGFAAELVAPERIDLSQVAYVLLPDGTQVNMP